MISPMANSLVYWCNVIFHNLVHCKIVAILIPINAMEFIFYYSITSHIKGYSIFLFQSFLNVVFKMDEL